MPFWSDLTPLGKQLVLGVLAIILLPTVLLTQPWAVDVAPPQQQAADSGEHTIVTQRSEGHLEPSPSSSGAPPGVAQPAVVLPTAVPEYAWAVDMQTPKLLGSLMRSPVPPTGAQGGAAIAAQLRQAPTPAATPNPPASAAAPVPKTPEATPASQAAVGTMPVASVAVLVAAELTTPQPTPAPSRAAVLVATVIARAPAEAAATATPSPTATAIATATLTPLPTATPEPPPPSPEPEPPTPVPPTATSTPRPPTATPTPRPPTPTPEPPPPPPPPPEPVVQAPPPPPTPTPEPPPPPTPRTGCSVSASVGSPSLKPGATQSVTGNVACDGALAGLPMTVLASFGAATASCSGTASADGSATCSLRVDDFAQPVARVNVCFTWQGRQFCATTQFAVQPS